MPSKSRRLAISYQSPSSIYCFIAFPRLRNNKKLFAAWKRCSHGLTGSNPDRMYKSTLFESQRLLLGLNCLEPGQADRAHTHAEQDKFYFVLEGEGEFTIGDEAVKAGAGMTVLAPAGITHGVENKGNQRLVILMGLTPWQT